MTTIHTVLREDFGQLDRDLVRIELLAERGVCGVSFDALRGHLSIEYDPALIDDAKLVDIMCRHGVYPEPCTLNPNSGMGDG